MLDQSKIYEIEQLIDDKIMSLQSITGGDISDAFLLKGEKENYFIKINNSKIADDLFETEAKGLHLLSQHCRTPEIIHQGTFNNDKAAFLILDYIPSGQKNESFWNELGRDLALLHQNTSSAFGLDHSNYIGRLPQQNEAEKTWALFYTTQRLIPQVQLAFDNNLLPKKLLASFDLFYKKINDICPIENPSLIHGDLWSGNFMVNQNQEPVFIDPSVSFAHREMDLAMSLLFGGFDPLFYESYNNSFPLEKGFNERVSLYQLYYLLVHLNLFGKSYLEAVERSLYKYL